MAKNPVRAGLPTQIVAANLKRLRTAKGLSVRGLSALTARCDGTGGVPPNGVSEIENGRRRVDVDDLIALSTALDVSPAVLLMPLPDQPTDDGDGIVYLDDDDPLMATQVWRWITAQDSLTTAAMADHDERYDTAGDTQGDTHLDTQERELWRQRTLPRFARRGSIDG